MQRKSLLRVFVFAAAILQIVWFVLPQFEYMWMSEGAIVVASYVGFESSFDISPWLSWAILAFGTAVFLGLLYFGPWWRYLFLSVVLANTLLLLPFAGFSIETGLSIAIRDVVSTLTGIIIALLFFDHNGHKNDVHE